MKNRILLLSLAFLIIASLLAISACAPTTPGAATTAPASSAYKWPPLMTMMTGPAESPSYAMIIGWSSLLSADTSMQVRAVPTPMGAPAFRNLKAGTYQFMAESPTNIGSVIDPLGGNAAPDGGPFQIRGIWTSSKSVTGFMVGKNSGIKTPYDLKGKRVAWQPSLPIEKVLFTALLAWGNLTENDVTWVPFSSTTTEWGSINDNKADVVFTMPAAPGILEFENSPGGIAWIQMDAKADPAGQARFSAIFPLFGFGINDTGVPSSIGLKGIATISQYLAKADTDPELVYNLCKWLDKNFVRYQSVSPMMKYYSMDTVMEMVNSSFIPAHDGLIRYLKEAGKWTAANDTRQAANIDLITKYVNAYADAMAKAKAQNIDVNPDNKAWLDFWVTYKKTANLPVIKVFPGL